MLASVRSVGRVGRRVLGDSRIACYSQTSASLYHSYPNPDEKPQISTFTANTPKQLNKKDEFALDAKFKMDKLFPGVVLGKPIRDSTTPKTVSTKLSNGLTVGTQETPGLMTSLAFIVNTGSSYEVQKEGDPKNNTGVSHFIELNGFRTTKNRSHMDVVTEVQKYGGLVQCIATRENILYCIDVLRENVEQGFDILADAVLNPTYPAEELEESRQIVEFQQHELPSEVFSRDLVQRAAYQGPLSNHQFCPLDKVQNIDVKMINAFRADHFFGDNCVVAGAGIDHDHLVALAEKKFGSMRKGSRADVRRVESVYTGGMLTNQRELKDPFIKIAMAFDCGGWSSKDLVPVCVLMHLLGGGSSFSAGGPGKGMYTRLYTQVLNKHYFAESVEAFISIHEDYGLFGIDGACPPDSAANLIRVMVDQFAQLANVPVNDEELGRAKNMLKSMMMMQLESRLVVCEDIARQFVTYGKRDVPSEVCEKIDKVTATDLMRVASLMLEKAPTIGCVGHDLSYVPQYNEIKQFTQQYNHQVWLQQGKK